jgi:NADH dehydrogenase
MAADLKNPASLAQVCEGVSEIITTASSTLSRQEGDSIESVDRAGYLSLIETAKTAGVRHFVYTSIPLNMRYDSPLVQAKRQAEATLAASGVPYTVLASNYFMEMWLNPALGFDYPNARATIYGSGERPLAWISYRDVAAHAVESLNCSAARNRVLSIGGPENLAPSEVIRIFSETGGRRFETTHLSDEMLQRQYENAANPLDKSFASLMLQYAYGCATDTTEIQSIMPRKLKTVQEYAVEMTGR